MQSMQIFISKAFRKESEDIFEYIYSKSISGAVKCKNGMSQYINTLKKFPYIGRYIPEISDKSYKERIYTNYRIVYQILKKLQLVYIHFIVHSKMDFLEYYKLYIKRRGKYEKERKNNKHVRKQNGSR